MADMPDSGSSDAKAQRLAEATAEGVKRDLSPLGANPLGTPRVWPLALPPVRLPWERKS
jgi:hypothetical protein